MEQFKYMKKEVCGTISLTFCATETAFSMLQISIACPHIPVRNINFEIFLHTCAQN